jgi:hypothetical protein
MRTPLGFYQYTVTNVVNDLTDVAGTGFTIPAGTQYVLLSAEGAHIRFRDDGTAPTASVGLLILTTLSAPFEYWGPLTPVSTKPAFRFIGVSGSAILNAGFYK